VLFEAFAGSSKRYLNPSDVLQLCDVYLVPMRDKVVAALKAVLGDDYVMFADFQVQMNMFGGGAKRGWHVDSGSEGRATYLMDPAYKFVKCGVFLQHNTLEWGGGIDVVPGGHRFPLRTSNPKLSFRVKNLANEISRRFFPKMVKTAPGDFVFFDSRLPHTSTWPAKLGATDAVNSHLGQMPLDHTKFVIYWNSCQKTAAPGFIANSLRRAEQEEIRDGSPELYFSDFLSRRYPEDFPSDFRSAATAQRVAVATLSIEDAAEWARRRQRREEEANFKTVRKS
jgi:hypothetical protein